MKIIAYTTTTQPCAIRPANPRRPWMDAARNKSPYRCLPLSMANGWGWEVLSSAKFTAEWDGNMTPGGVKITLLDGTNPPNAHFGEGTITWHLGYVFKTSFPYGLYVTGAPNYPKPSVTPLSGVVETYWLPFTFTMNWQFTQPGKFTMDIGEPFCQLFPVDMNMFDEIEPEIRSLHEPEAKEFYEDYWQWNASRCEFLYGQRTGLNGPGKWQKNYTQGKYAVSNSINQCPVHTTDTDDNKESSMAHRTKANVPAFIDKQIEQFKQPDWYKEVYAKYMKKQDANTEVASTNTEATVDTKSEEFSVNHDKSDQL